MTDRAEAPEVPHFRLPDLSWPQLPAHLQDRIGYCSTWRAEPPGASVYGFNLGLHVGDDAQTVLERRRALAAHYAIRPVWMKQVHGTDCTVSGDADLDALSASVDSITADAAFTQVPGIAPLVMTADCLPVLLVDNHGEGVAAVHCGWRGLVSGAIESTLTTFERHGLGREGLHAWLGPCIGHASFEVGAEVRDAFLSKNPVHESCFKASASGAPRKWLADLQGLAVQILTAYPQVSISVDSRDTARDPRLNSYRRNPVTGRQASLIWIKPRPGN